MPLVECAYGILHDSPCGILRVWFPNLATLPNYLPKLRTVYGTTIIGFTIR